MNLTTSSLDESAPEGKRFNKVVQIITASTIILISICAGLTGLYRYATYDSLCLEIKPNNHRGYILQVINPDMEAVQSILKDYLVNYFSQQAHEPGYPQVETTLDSWPRVINWKLPFRLPGEPDVPQELRSSYRIGLNKDIGVRLWYYRYSHETVQLVPIPLYIIQSWAPAQIDPQETPLVVVSAEWASSITLREAVNRIDEVDQLNSHILNALDHLKSCH